MSNVEPTRAMNAANPPASVEKTQLPATVNPTALPAEVQKALAMPATPDSPETLARELTAAKVAERARAIEQIDLGLPEFRESSAQEVRQAESLLREAHLARKRENYREAEAKCREALQFVPKDAAALELLGDLLQGIARIDEALAAYKRALLADPKRSSAERKYADLLMRQQEWDSTDIEAVPKNSKWALGLSLLLPGAGQIHNGEPIKGILILLVSIVCVFSYTTRSPAEVSPDSSTNTTQGKKSKLPIDWNATIPLIAGGAVYIYAIADANAKSSRRSGSKKRASSGWDV